MKELRQLSKKELASKNAEEIFCNKCGMSCRSFMGDNYGLIEAKVSGGYASMHLDDGEMHEWRYDHGDEKKGHFEKWAQNPVVKPLIIIQGTDDKPHVVDGHHRAAMAHIKNMKTVPVVYGTRKSK